MGFLYYRRSFVEKQNPPSDTKVQDMKTDGRLELIAADGKSVYTHGEDVVIMVYADSAKYPVIGYDMVFDRGATDMKLESAESLVEGFTIFSNTENDFVSITGLQDDLGDKEFIFQNEPVARLVFKPQTTGAQELKFRFAVGETSDSNLVSTSTADVLGKAKGITVYVGSDLKLQTGADVKIDDQTTARLEKVIEPDAACRDCVTEASVTFTSRDAKGVSHVEKLNFTFGGIAGQMYATEQVLGYIISAYDISSSSLVINYAPLL